METDNISDEIYGYTKNGSNIEVFTTKGKTIKVFNSEKNEKKILNQIEKNRRKMIKEYDPYDPDMKIFNEMTTATGIIAIIVSCTMISKAYKGTFDMNLESYIGLIMDSPLFIVGSLIYKEDKKNKKIVEKYNLFFENQEKLNKLIKSNPSLLDKINSDAKEALKQNISNNNGIPPLNINTVRKMKLKELKKLLEQAKLTNINNELNLETVEDVINNYDNLDELTKKYDSVKRPNKKH